MSAHRGKKVALDAARGLHYLHSHHVIHLDLKSGECCARCATLCHAMPCRCACPCVVWLRSKEREAAQHSGRLSPGCLVRTQPIYSYHEKAEQR